MKYPLPGYQVDARPRLVLSSNCSTTINRSYIFCLSNGQRYGVQRHTNQWSIATNSVSFHSSKSSCNMIKLMPEMYMWLRKALSNTTALYSTTVDYITCKRPPCYHEEIMNINYLWNYLTLHSNNLKVTGQWVQL